jgi:type I restriction enzyme M protein
MSNGSNEILQKLWNLLEKRRGNGEILRYVVPDLIFLFALSTKHKEEKEKAPSHGKEDPAYYTINLPLASKWDYIMKEVEKNPQKTKEIIYLALDTIEKQKLRNKQSLEGLTHKERFKDRDLTDYNLQLIIKDLNEKFHEHTWNYDFLGVVYQFFLQQFATKGGKQGGEFYTPTTVVELLVNIIQPAPNSFVYDPCCGSGGMFVQSKKFINRKNGIVCLGQERNPDTLRLAKMRLIIEGLNFRLTLGDTIFEDFHSQQQADFVLANPPFNQKIKEENNFIPTDGRWEKYGVPNNTNYAWISHIIYKLKKEDGAGAIIISNITLSSLNKTDLQMRKKWISDNLIEAIITLPNNLFYTTSISPCIWIIRKGREQENVLMIDISQDEFGQKLSSSKRILTKDGIKLVADLYQEFRQNGKINSTIFPAKVVEKEQIINNNYILVPVRYFSTNDNDLMPQEVDQRLLETTKELENLIDQQDQYHQELRELLKKIKQEIENK